MAIHTGINLSCSHQSLIVEKISTIYDCLTCIENKEATYTELRLTEIRFTV